MADITKTVEEYVKSKLHERTILIGSKEQLYEYFETHANSELLEVSFDGKKIFKQFDCKEQLDKIEDTSPNGYGKVFYLDKEQTTQENIVIDAKYVLIKKY